MNKKICFIGKSKNATGFFYTVKFQLNLDLHNS